MLSAEPDFEYVLVDATICKTHADATSQKGGLKLPVLADLQRFEFTLNRNSPSNDLSTGSLMAQHKFKPL